MGISYQDVGMVNDSLDSLNRVILAKREAARQAARDKEDALYRTQTLAGQQAESAANREFRTTSAAAEKAHQDRLAAGQQQHFKTIEEQGKERNAAVRDSLIEKSRGERSARAQKTLDWLSLGVKDGIIPADQANAHLQNMVKNTPPEWITGTPFEDIGDNFFQPPPPKKAENTGKTQIKIGADGLPEKTITRDYQPGDEKMPSDVEVAMTDARKALMTATLKGDKKMMEAAQKQIDDLAVMLDAEKASQGNDQSQGQPGTVGVYYENGVLERKGKGGASVPGAKATPTKPKISIGKPESVALPGINGSYSFQETTENDVPEIRQQKAKVAELESQIQNMGNSAPTSVPVPIYGAQAGGITRPTTTEEKIKHDLRVRGLLEKLKTEREKLETLRSAAQNPKQ